MFNNWSSGGRTRHMDARVNFVRELKEEGLLRVHWIAGTDNCADLFTKNLPGPLFDRHVRVSCGDDEYMGTREVQHGGNVAG